MTFHMMTRSRTRRQKHDNPMTRTHPMVTRRHTRNTKLAQVFIELVVRIVATLKNTQPHRTRHIELLDGIVSNYLINGYDVDHNFFVTQHINLAHHINRECINANVDVSGIPNYNLFVELVR